MAFSVKVYVVQRADRNGDLRAEPPIAVKLTFAEARKVAMLNGVAPAKITLLVADKTDKPNGEGQIGHYSVCEAERFDSRRNPLAGIDEGGFKQSERAEKD